MYHTTKDLGPLSNNAVSGVIEQSCLVTGQKVCTIVKVYVKYSIEQGILDSVYKKIRVRITPKVRSTQFAIENICCQTIRTIGSS